jgi:hypothetical protein
VGWKVSWWVDRIFLVAVMTLLYFQCHHEYQHEEMEYHTFVHVTATGGDGRVRKVAPDEWESTCGVKAFSRVVLTGFLSFVLGVVALVVTYTLSLRRVQRQEFVLLCMAKVGRLRLAVWPIRGSANRSPSSCAKRVAACLAAGLTVIGGLAQAGVIVLEDNETKRRLCWARLRFWGLVLVWALWILASLLYYKQQSYLHLQEVAGEACVNSQVG